MFIIFMLVSVVLIKLSLIGQGLMSIAIGAIAWIVCRKLPFKLDPVLKQKFSRLFATAALLHISLYLVLIAKMTLIDKASDIPGFMLSHLLLHHLVCALLAAPLVFMTVAIYNTRRTLNQG
ncbi:hypothetical protein L2725_08190 [Shewanella corallii]|uniref:Uncharacterized protein n=1 Tax=Shewanella corallii TaxID=560080 RepID=A0ABT0N5X0_9GAMM|nr:hypothetical protein [Shewanella corallii]